MDRIGEAPAYSQGLEFAVSMFLRGMEPENKLVLARRMLQVFAHLEQQALDELGAAERKG
jgi:hypothetical protein